MISVADNTALALVVLAALAGVGWGAALSIMSAGRGPAWALRHLRSASPFVLGVLVVGVLLVGIVRPRWAGIGVTYVAGTVWLLGEALRRSLGRVEATGGFGEISVERRAALLLRSRRVLLLGGGVLALISLLGTGLARAGGLTLAAVLAGTGLLVGRR